ncbi:MAG: nucleotidyltransferase family protein [Pseudomonadota bacterium]
MKDWKKAVILSTSTIHDAIVAIDISCVQTALVVDGSYRLMGTITDGDIRRAVLKNLPLDDSVAKVMNINPTIARQGDSQDNILITMKLTGHRHIPILDNDDRLVNVAIMDDMIKADELENWVIVMAGGLGTRLRPLTNDCPKPLLRVGDKPILETIIENCKTYGFRKIFLSINYKAEMIKKYFRDGSHLGLSIEYLEEDERLGTAGALSLLPEAPNKPIVVMNGDLLTKVNFQHLLDFHRHNQAKATMCVREFEMQVPYGVVSVQDQRISSIIEKPKNRFLINAGIYVLEPETLKLIPKKSYFDMPQLFNWMIERGLSTSAFPVREYWIDIGQMPDFEKAKDEFQEIFA